MHPQYRDIATFFCKPIWCILCGKGNNITEHDGGGAPCMNTQQLDAFYASSAGLYTQKALLPYFSKRPLHKEDKCLAVGYVAPFLTALRATHKVALIPHDSGITPAITPDTTLLTYKEGGCFPLKENTFQHIFLIHCLESALYPAHLLREATRRLQPGGRLTLFVPQSKTCWRSDRFPWEANQTWSPDRIKEQLEQNQLTLLKSNAALLFPSASKWNALMLPLEHTLRCMMLDMWGNMEIVQAAKMLSYTGQKPQERQLMPQLSS